MIIQNYLYDLCVLLRCEKRYGRNFAHCCVVISSSKGEFSTWKECNILFRNILLREVPMNMYIPYIYNQTSLCDRYIYFRIITRKIRRLSMNMRKKIYGFILKMQLSTGECVFEHQSVDFRYLIFSFISYSQSNAMLNLYIYILD